MTLTEAQQEIVDLIEQTSSNYLIHGKPGVGKSVLIRSLIESGKKFYTLSAPTGLAALNIEGRTLHSIFRLPISQGIIEESYNNFTLDDRTLNFIRFRIKHLIIDEVSMVRADTLDYVDRLLRHVKNTDEPFGGVQVILVGDFFQLPPIVRREEEFQFKNCGYKSPFAFDAKCFKGNFKVLQLNEVLRQKGDDWFIRFLHGARSGKLTKEQINIVNKTCVKEPEEFQIQLTGTNKQADEINTKELNKIDSSLEVFIGEVFGEWPALPAEKELQLKVGAQVMIKMNGSDRPPGHRGEWESNVVNGTIGKVLEIRRAGDSIETRTSVDSVVVELEDGTSVTIYRRRWERKIKYKNEEGKWEEKVVASYEQIPLSLAWAISMHKSQGQTFDRVHIDASKIFAPGQLYVAISRCRTLKGISLQNPVDTKKFWANLHVIRFNEEIE